MGRYRRYRSRNAGLERALQHIREGEQLSRELGGTDVDVKEYFFGLSPSELRPILDEYERRHGKERRDYAERTIPAWRSKQRKMSGEVASRLFDLLPRYMPLARKYALVESLWRKLAPQSEYSLSFGPNANQETIRTMLADHVNTTVRDHQIAEGLQRRFEWLADGDSQVMQQLLNHYLMRDREESAQMTDSILSIVLPNLRNGDGLQGFRRELKVGGHVVHVFFDPRATEVKIQRGSPQYQAAPDYSWVGCLVVAAIVIALLVLLSQ